MARRWGLAAAIVAIISTGLVLAAVGGTAASKGKGTTIKLTAKLSGEREIPTADRNGAGKAKVKLKPKQRRACFKIRFERIGKPIMAHIHKGTKDVNGPIRVLLFDDPTSSPASGCADAKRRLLKKIARKPKRWYVNVHTQGFPDGAIRGQLKRRGGGGGGSGGGGGAGGGAGGGPPY